MVVFRLVLRLNSSSRVKNSTRAQPPFDHCLAQQATSDMDWCRQVGKFLAGEVCMPPCGGAAPSGSCCDPEPMADGRSWRQRRALTQLNMFSCTQALSSL